MLCKPFQIIISLHLSPKHAAVLCLKDHERKYQSGIIRSMKMPSHLTPLKRLAICYTHSYSSQEVFSAILSFSFFLLNSFFQLDVCSRVGLELRLHELLTVLRLRNDDEEWCSDFEFA
jgi:hypothetical protein